MAAHPEMGGGSGHRGHSTVGQQDERLSRYCRIVHAPVPADVYALDTSLILAGDAHASRRPAGVVETPGDYVILLGRTTSPVTGPSLVSAAVPECRLEKAGKFSERFKHSQPRSAFGDPSPHEFRGHLPPDQEAALLAYWEQCKGY